jgi:hypothetical protein
MHIIMFILIFGIGSGSYDCTQNPLILGHIVHACCYHGKQFGED